MAEKKFQRGSDEWTMFQDYYKIVQDFYLAEENDSYWEKVIDATDMFCKKYKNVRFSRNLGLALINYLSEWEGHGKEIL